MVLHCEYYEVQGWRQVAVQGWWQVAVQGDVLMVKVVLQVEVAYHDGGDGGDYGEVVEERNEVVELEKVPECRLCRH